MKLLFLIILFLILTPAYAVRSLNITGQLCSGNESTAARMNGIWSEYICLDTEWLIEIEDMVPFIARLVKKSESAGGDYTFYHIIPTIPVDPEVRWKIKQHWIRASWSGELLILHK